MKILICSLTYPLPNGVTVSINTAVDGFLEAGHKIAIIGPKYKIGKVRPEHFPVASSFLSQSIGVLIGKEERTFGINAHSQIKKIVKEFNPDAFWLHTISFAANTFENIMFKSSRSKVIFYHTMVEDYGRIYAGKLGATTMIKRSRQVCNKADAIMTPSNLMKKKLKNYEIEKPIYVIPTGIEIPKKHFSKKEIQKKYKIPGKYKILLYVGRISREKNINVLLKTIEKLKDSALLLVGPGDIEETKKEAKALNIETRVFFTGPLPKENAQKIYGAADIFLFASQTETQGLVVGEAMLGKIPVVALKSPIQPEVYPKNVAVVVDNEEELPLAVQKVLKNKKSSQNMVKRAEKFVIDNFSKKQMIQKQVNVFKKLITL